MAINLGVASPFAVPGNFLAPLSHNSTLHVSNRSMATRVDLIFLTNPSAPSRRVGWSTRNTTKKLDLSLHRPMLTETSLTLLS
jgi:hypothetical protein